MAFVWAQTRSISSPQTSLVLLQTLTWKSPDGGRIATFERIKKGGFFSGKDTYRDFSSMLVKGWEKGYDCSKKKPLFFIQ